MDELSLLRKRNLIKMVGSISILLALILSPNSSDLLMNGPDMLTGVCLSIAVACLLALAIHRKF